MTDPIDKFISVTGTTMTARNTPFRKEDNESFKDMIHFDVTVMRGELPVWKGEYSVGVGHVHSWVKENENKAGQPVWDRVRSKDMPRIGASRMTISEKETLDRAVEQFKKKAPVKLGDVLTSLASDAENSDQRFEDWASDLGYSDDSISAKKTWEACNDVRRSLEAAYTGSEMEQLYAIARDEDPYAAPEDDTPTA